MAVSNYAPGQELSSIDFQSMIGGPLGAIVDAQAQAALSTVDFIKAVGFTPDSTNEDTGVVTPGTPVYVNFKYPKMVAPYEPAIKGVVKTATIKTAGTGYAVGDVLTILGDGEGATASVSTIGADGSITKIDLSNKGKGYENGDIPASGGTGTGAVIKVVTDDVAAVPAVFNEMQLEVPILTMLPIPFIRVEEGEINFHAKITSMEHASVGSKFNGSTSFGYNSTTSGSTGGGSGGITSLFVKASAKVKYSSSVNFKVNASYQRTSRQGSKVEKTYQLGVKVKVTQDEIPEGMEKLLGILEDAIVSQPIAS